MIFTLSPFLNDMRSCRHKEQVLHPVPYGNNAPTLATDLTDSQWEAIAPLFKGMRNRYWPKRELLNALLYKIDNGCEWRNLPHDFPPWKTVYTFFLRAKKSCVWDEIPEFPVEISKQIEGRGAEPTYGIIDSQSVKTTSSNEARGIDGGKKNKGRKRHIVVDTLGKLLAVIVHAATLICAYHSNGSRSNM